MKMMKLDEGTIITFYSKRFVCHLVNESMKGNLLTISVIHPINTIRCVPNFHIEAVIPSKKTVIMCKDIQRRY